MFIYRGWGALSAADTEMHIESKIVVANRNATIFLMMDLSFVVFGGVLFIKTPKNSPELQITKLIS